MRWATSLLLGACAPAGSRAADTGPAPARFEVAGQVVDLDGAPAVDLFVTVSTAYCIPDRTDADGQFTVGRVDPGAKRLITYGETASNGPFASVSLAFEADRELRFEAPIHTPRLDQSLPVDPEADQEQVLKSAEGLELRIPPGSLDLAPFAPEAVQIARVPLDLAPPFPADGPGLLDLFVLHPIRSTLDPPAPVAFPADLGLDPGLELVVHALDYDTGRLVPVATATTDPDGRPRTDPGQGLPELTWIGLSLE